MKRILIGGISFWFIGLPAFAADVALSEFNIDLHGGVAILSAAVGGQGFSADQGATNGSAYGANFGYGLSDGARLHLKYDRAQVEFDTPSLISPDRVNAARDEYSVLLMVAPFGSSFWRDMRLGIGYTYLSFAVEQTTPALLTQQVAQGVSLLGEQDLQFNDQWYSTFGLLAFLPHRFVEENVQTGFNPNYLGGEVSLRLNWRVREDLRIYAGGSYRVDIVSFEGTGGRLVSDGMDTRTAIHLPVGVNWDL